MGVISGGVGGTIAATNIWNPIEMGLIKEAGSVSAYDTIGASITMGSVAGRFSADLLTGGVTVTSDSSGLIEVDVIAQTGSLNIGGAAEIGRAHV